MKLPNKSDPEALKRLRERVVQEEEKRKSKNLSQSSNNKTTSKKTTSNTSKASNPLEFSALRRYMERNLQRKTEEQGRTNKSAPASTKKNTATKKYADYNTETKNSYDSVKKKLNTKTTIKSNLSDDERNKRIKEIKSELGTLNTKLSGYSRASAYGTSKAMTEAKKKDEARIVELKQELKNLERVGTFSASELKQFEVDDAKAKVSSARQKVNSYGARPTLDSAEAYKQANSELYNAREKLNLLEREQAEYKRIEKLNELNAHTTAVTSKKDFAQNSKYSPAKPKTDEELKAEGYKLDKEGKWYKTYGFGYRESYTGGDSDTYTYINDPSKRLAIETDIQQLTGENMYRTLGYHTLTEDEVGAFNYLYHQDRKNGTKMAEQYLQKISPLLQERAMELEAQSYAKIAKEAPFMMSVLSLGTNLENAAMYPVKLAATATGSYDDIPLLDMYGNRTQAIRGGVSEDMPYWGNLVYNGAMSIGDMGVALAVSGGNPKVVQAVMSSSAGSSTISEAKKNGASDGKALVLGLGSAAIEWATEKYSVEAILKDPKTIKGFILANTFTEATEEGASNISNIALDTIVSEVFGERSEIEQRIDYLVLYEGKTEEEALNIAVNEKLQNLGEDVLVGGLTGFGMSGAKASAIGVNNAITNKGVIDTYIEDEKSLDALIEEGKASGEGSESFKIAKEVEQAKEKGTLTKSQVKKLISANEKAIKSEESAPTTLEQTAREVVEKRNRVDGIELLEARKRGEVTPQMLERLSQVNAQITNEEAKKATGFGDRGAELVAKAVNTDGATFYQTVAEVRPSYLAGFNNPDMDIKKVAHTFNSQAQQDAYTAGQQDAVMQNRQAEVKAKNARVFGDASGVIENEHSAQYSPEQMRMADTIGKDLGSQVSFEERLLANEETGYETNAYHQNGEIKISNNSDNKFIEDIMEESLHRMSEIDTEAVRVLKRATYEFITEIERSKGTEGFTFDEEKALYDNAGQSINTRGIMEEVSVGVLSRELFKDEKQWLRWRERLNTDSKLRQAWYKLMDIVSEIIEKIERLLAEKSFSKETRDKVNKEMADLKRLKGLYTDAYVATRDAVAEKTNNQNTKTQTETRTEATQSPVASENVSSNKETPSKPKNKPQAKNKAVKVGETYTANATGKTYTITERSDTHTTYTVTDKNGKTTTRKITNNAADINFNRKGEEGFTKVQGNQGIKVGDVFTAKDTTYKIISRDAMNTKVEISSEEGTQTMVISNEIADRNFSNMSEEGITKWIDEDMHIDNRTWDEVGDRKVKAFQFLFPEMKEYYTPLAQELLGDLDNTIEGERIKIGSYEMNNEEWIGVSRYTSEAIATIKDSTNATYDDIRNALHRLINDEGEENIALAKRIELVFDDMLTNGYTTFDGTEIEANEEYITKKEALIGKTYEKYVPSEDEELPYFSLKNKNLTINSRIPFTVLNDYTNVAKGDYAALHTLETEVGKLKKGTYQNDATGYSADVTSETIGKAINPTNKKFNRFKEAHIRNLNAMLKLPELFKKAVYVDSKNPQKTKNQNKAIKDYHHFVAPIFMDNGEYRALITAREKINSNTLYVLRVEVLPTQKRHTPLATQQKNAGGSQLLSVPSDISIPELVSGVKIYNYDTNTFDTYYGNDIQFSLKTKAPTFYSQMAKTIDGIKQDKIGANSVVSYLTGRGVKAEEIKWSGIETFLEGKKSVSKAELQEFVAGSMLQIETKTLTEKPTIDYTEDESNSLAGLSGLYNEYWEKIDKLWMDKYGEEISWDIRFNDNAEDSLRLEMRKLQRDDAGSSDFFNEVYKILGNIRTVKHNEDAIIRRATERTNTKKGNLKTKYEQYTLDGGSNYRELLFKLPNSEYTNESMSYHWGEEGILAHARIQDFDVGGQKMLFIEEIQSDWHNEGQKKGYADKGKAKQREKYEALREKNKAERKSLIEELSKHYEGKVAIPGESAEKLLSNIANDKSNFNALIKRDGISDTLAERIVNYEISKVDEALQLQESLKKGVEDAPFHNNYHEYVLKILLRMAAEDGYDSIGWTTADIQSDRWSDEYAEGYRIEYDQDIPKFLNKYGKKWGAKVGKTEIESAGTKYSYTDNDGKKYVSVSDWYNSVMDNYAETDKSIWNDYISGYYKINQEGNKFNIQHRNSGNILDNTLEEIQTPATVWSMPITDSMKESVLYEGQPMFSLKKPVETTKNLIAVHNMQSSELERTLDLGGLPMPSIAIIKAQRGHSEYGDVSLVFDKSVIDPNASKLNKVYGGDAWTPTYPTIEYKPNEKIAKKIRDKYYDFSRTFGYEESRPLYSYVNDLENQLNRNKGEAGMLEELYNDTRVMQFYLLDSGKGKVETINKETRTELTDEEVKMHEFFIKELGSDVVDEAKWDGETNPQTYRKNYMSKYEGAIREAYKKFLSQEYQFTEEEVQNALDNTNSFKYLSLVRDAQRYRENGRVTIKKEADYEATQNAIREAAGEDYRKWVDSLFKGIEEKSGIRNNLSYYTNSGNQRSWEALHWENNLENVVKVMKSQDDVGGGTFFSAHAIWGVSAKDYRSIEEIKADSERLKSLPKEEYTKIKESFGDRLTEIANSIMDKSERNPFIAVDNAVECIVDAIRSSKTKSGILNNLRQYQQLTVSETTVDDIVSLVSDIANMPTEYFEAKPKRAVELNEIATAIIPDNTSEATKARLNDMGIKFVEYETGNENARLEALNSLEDVKFSLKGRISPMDLLDTIGDAQKGKKGAAEKLAKYVESGMIRTKTYDELVEKYGVIPSGERPHRDVQVPRKTGKNKKVSQTVRTILEAKVTPDEAVPTIEKMVEDGIFSYDAYSDKQAIADSEAYIKEYGWDESLDDWFDAVNSGEVSKELTTMGWALYNNAANIAATTTSESERTTAIKTSLKILDAMVRHQRSAAQALQATRILKKLSPETQLYGVQKSVQALQNELTEKYGDKAPNLTIDEELAEEFINAKTPEERAKIEKEIYKDIGRQMPSHFIDKWNAWRYLAMLGNPRTHIRNIVGNMGFAPIVGVKNLTATAIESAVSSVVRWSGKEMVRGKSLVWGSKTDRALLSAAWNDYANVADMISNGGKYNDSAMANQNIQDGRRIFKFKPLEWARKGNSQLLEMEDMWFSKPHYAYALAQHCKANNITAEQISRGRAIAPARDYAIKEAQKATYRDTNAFSQMVSSWGRNKSEKNVVKKAFNTVIEGILPFRKTPANILVRGVEYSPLGLIKGLSYDLVQVGKGKMLATEAIDNISAGLTGTGLLALGVLLAAQGLIRGHGEDEKDEKEFKEMMGHQAYALELPNGQSITLDWLAPEALPFFVGVNIWETTRGTDEDVNLSTILQSVSGISEPMLEMSCLQSLNDLFESVGYASSNDTSGLVSVLSSAVTSYLTQGIPTLSGQAERTSEEERMTTYTEKDAFLTGDMQYTLGKISAKIPFWDYNQIPYIDAWGRKEASGVALKRGLNNFLNPAYTSTIDTSDVEEELLSLYEMTGDSGVFPSRADKSITVDGEDIYLTADEYVRYATLKGEKSYKLVSDLVNSSAYKKLSTEEQAKAVKEAYDYANQKAKESISNYKPDNWVSKADEFANVGNYISFKTEVASTKEDNDGKISKQEVVDIVLDMAQNDSETWKMYLSMYDSTNDLYAYNKGIDGETYMYFLEALNEVDTPTKSGKYGTYTQAEAKNAVNQLDGLSRDEKAVLWQSVNTGWKRNPYR